MLTQAKRSVAIFDLGGVLIDWDPRHLYRKLFAGDDAAMELFLATICTPQWNRQLDAGRRLIEATVLLKAQYPDQAALIDAYGARFDEMMAGPIAGTVAILSELRERNVPLYSLSNWSADTYHDAPRRFDFLDGFRGIVISGTIGIVKPDPGIYRHLLESFSIAPETAIFIDDVAANAAAATTLGIHGIHFTGAAALRDELIRLGFL